MLRYGRGVSIAIVLVIVASAAIFAGLVFWIGRFLRNLRLRSEQRLAPRGNPRLIANARSLGVTSRDNAQARGNGTLALYATELVFVQWIPERELVLDLASITGVSNVDSHLGKRVGGRLLKVIWADGDGPNSIALHVADLPEWTAALRALTSSR